MSQLDQAKKEAKRLFNIAKANQENNSNVFINNQNNNYLAIENLSKAREVLSLINGYKNWHEYEEVLKRKDFLFEKTDKNSINKENKQVEENQAYYIQDICFNTIVNPNINNTVLVVEKPHKNIIMGRHKEKSFFETKEKKWILNQYPMLISAATGAGKTETLLSMTSQYMENKEGIIYFDGKGDSSIYTKIFSYATQYNRLNDLYCLNFMIRRTDLIDENNDGNNQETTSHSIDPINPMLGNDEFFNNFFGRLGVIIHSILKEINYKNQLMDIQSLESILMLNNLINWHKNNKFTTKEISIYLTEIGLSLDGENDEHDFNEALLKHSINANNAYKIIDLLKSFPDIFKIDCSISMEKIFLERKILLILLPALEKTVDVFSHLGNIISSQVKYIEEKYQRYNTHFQNIIIDEFHYFAHCLNTLPIKMSENNYIFGCMNHYVNNDIFNYVLNNVNTNLIMKLSDPQIHNKIKLDLINNLTELPKLKYNLKGNSFIQNFNNELRELREGQGYILSKNYQKNDEDIINNDNKYYCEYITCEYLPSKKPTKIWLVNHPKPLIFIKE